MLEDYESGVRRKPNSRHVVGRMRWILLASLVINFFLFYKYWSHGTTIVILEQKTKRINSDLATERKQIEHYKKQTMMTEERRTNCEKRLSEIDDKLNECQLRHKECSNSLETTSAKLMEMNQNVKSLTEAKEIIEIDFEKKTTELESVKEQVARLQNELEKFQRNQNNAAVVQQSPIVRQKPEVADHGETDQSDELKNQEGIEEREIQKGEIQDINSINPPMQKMVEEQHEEKREAGEEVFKIDKSDNAATPSEIIRRVPNLASESTVFIECDFSEQNLNTGKCNYMMEPKDHSWEFGKPVFLKGYTTQCLYIDDSASGLGLKKSLIFQEMQTDKCLKIALNVTVVGGGQLSIHDNDKFYDVTIETSNPEVPLWKLVVFNLTPAPSHTIEITGIVSKYGGVGLTRVLLNEGDCGPDIKSEVEFDDKIDEHDREMVDDIA